ncbi:MAG TPA: hypothetical protein VN310_16210 [Candidatus Dormibacteraeota bacterium]|jgi:hypothetical protein|nr:hypothetical protein [Candidatus Dormibacteraeota bacterium]
MFRTGDRVLSVKKKMGTHAADEIVEEGSTLAERAPGGSRDETCGQEVKVPTRTSQGTRR